MRNEYGRKHKNRYMKCIGFFRDFFAKRRNRGNRQAENQQLCNQLFHFSIIFLPSFAI